MFTPKPFHHCDMDAIIELIGAYPLATVSYVADGTAQACHVPVLSEHTDNGIRLFTHVARANPIWQHLDTPWLLSFVGASHYISANWYPSKALTHKEVPTYNYQAVHIRATPSIATGADAIQILAKTTDYFENQLHTINPEHMPWRLTDAPDEFIHKMCQALVAIDLQVIDIQASFKLSQNKDAQNRQGVIDGLSQLNTHESDTMAKLVAKFAKS